MAVQNFAAIGAQPVCQGGGQCTDAAVYVIHTTPRQIQRGAAVQRVCIVAYGLRGNQQLGIQKGVQLAAGAVCIGKLRNRAQQVRQRAQRGLPARFILYLGTIEPRKNLPVLIAAYKQAQLENVKLVCAGGQGWMYADVFRAVEELHLSREVLFPGYVPEAELPLWYSAAEAFVYPSAYEGFGLPVLEALACGTPVITTTAGSLVEVAGNAAVLCAPDDAPALADAIVRVMGDPLLRGQLAASGPLQADRFCWQEAGRRTASTHLRALSPQH